MSVITRFFSPPKPKRDRSAEIAAEAARTAAKDKETKRLADEAKAKAEAEKKKKKPAHILAQIATSSMGILSEAKSRRKILGN